VSGKLWIKFCFFASINASFREAFFRTKASKNLLGHNHDPRMICYFCIFTKNKFNRLDLDKIAEGYVSGREDTLGNFVHFCEWHKNFVGS